MILDGPGFLAVLGIGVGIGLLLPRFTAWCERLMTPRPPDRSLHALGRVCRSRQGGGCSVSEKLRGRGWVGSYRVDLIKLPVNHWAFCTKCDRIIRPREIASLEEKPGKDGKRGAVCKTCAPIKDSTFA